MFDVLKNAATIAVSIPAVCLLAISVCAQEKPEEKITYSDHAKPIFVQRCSSCHNSERKDGDLDVTNYTNLMIGGGSGEVIEPGSASDSYLFNLVTHEESPEMPPSGDMIPSAQIEILRKWIDGGALENSGSVAKKRKPKKDYSAVASGESRPELEPVPSRLPLTPQLVAARPSSVHSIAANPWSPFIAVSSPQQVLIFGTKDFALRGIIPFKLGQPETIRFSRNGTLILIGGGKPGASGKVMIWDAIKGREVAQVGDELDSVLAADIHPAQTIVALGGPKKIVRVYGIDGESIYDLKKHTEWITALQFSPNGNFLVSGDRNGGVHAWEAKTGNEILTLPGHKKSITSIDWRIDGKLLLTASEDGTVKVWDGTNGKQIKSFTACGAGVTSACFTRDGLIVSGGRDRLVRVWDQNGKQLHQYEAMPDQVMSVAWCHETDRPIAGDWSGVIRVWDQANPKAIHQLDCNPPTIETRLAKLTQQLQQANLVYEPLLSQSGELDREIAAMKAENESEIESRSSLETNLKSVKTKLFTADQILEANIQQQEEWKKELSGKEKAIPQIQASLTNARSALTSLGTDQELEDTISKLEFRSKSITSRADELKTLLAQVTNKQKTTQAEIATFKTEQERLETDIASINNSISNREIQIGQANDRRSTLQSQLEKAKADLDRPRRALEFWKAEREFAIELTELEGSLVEAEEVEMAKLDELDVAEKKLAQAKAAVDAAKAQHHQSTTNIDSIEDKINSLKHGKSDGGDALK